MSRVNLGLITATVASLMAVDNAAAFGCFRPFGSCGSYAYAQPYYAPPPVYVQAPPQVVLVAPPPVVVQVAQPQVIVQQEPLVEQAPQMYVVNQGPHYAGPNLTDYSQSLYYPSRPARAYPYVNGYNGGYNGAGYNGGYNGAGYNGGYRMYNGGYRRPYVRPYMRPYARPYAHGARPYYHARYRGPVRRYY